MPNPKGNEASLKKFKPKWYNGTTQTIRVPIALAAEILDYAHKLDESPLQVDEIYLELSTVGSRFQESLDKQQLLTNQLNRCQQDRVKIADLLKPALKFPGNNAAPIKAQIRAVLALLDDAQKLEG
jgi:hypothetical protein